MTAAQVISLLFTLEVDQNSYRTSEVTTEVERFSRNFICMEGLSHHLCIWCVLFLSIKEFIHCQVWHPRAPAPVAVAAFGAMILPFFKSRWKSTKSDPIKEVAAMALQNVC